MSNKSTKTEEKTEEGPRAFSVFIQDLAEGEAHRQLSEQLHKVAKAVLSEAKARGNKAAGSITLKLIVASNSQGVAGVRYDIDVKLPKPQKSDGVFWITKGGNLTVENPRQLKLGVRDVGPVPGEARDPADNTQENATV